MDWPVVFENGQSNVQNRKVKQKEAYKLCQAAA